jgi:hypothetical protein
MVIKIKEDRRLNTHREPMTASHNSILSEIEGMKIPDHFMDNNIVHIERAIFFCLNFG